MDYGKILKIGFKVLIATVAGAAVFIGVDKVGNSNKRRQNVQEDPCFGEQPERINGTPTQIKRNADDSDFVNKMKNVQDACGKLFTFVQSLTTVADNFCRIFKNDSYVGQPYYNNPWGYGYQHPIDMGNGVIWNRISPFIVEASTDPRYYNRL